MVGSGTTDATTVLNFDLLANFRTRLQIGEMTYGATVSGLRVALHASPTPAADPSVAALPALVIAAGVADQLEAGQTTHIQPGGVSDRSDSFMMWHALYRSPGDGDAIFTGEDELHSRSRRRLKAGESLMLAFQSGTGDITWQFSFAASLALTQ